MARVRFCCESPEPFAFCEVNCFQPFMRSYNFLNVLVMFLFQRLPEKIKEKDEKLKAEMMGKFSQLFPIVIYGSVFLGKCMCSRLTNMAALPID